MQLGDPPLCGGRSPEQTLGFSGLLGKLELVEKINCTQGVKWWAVPPHVCCCRPVPFLQTTVCPFWALDQSKLGARAKAGRLCNPNLFLTSCRRKDCDEKTYLLFWAVFIHSTWDIVSSWIAVLWEGYCQATGIKKIMTLRAGSNFTFWEYVSLLLVHLEAECQVWWARERKDLPFSPPGSEKKINVQSLNGDTNPLRGRPVVWVCGFLQWPLQADVSGHHWRGSCAQHSSGHEGHCRASLRVRNRAAS